MLLNNQPLVNPRSILQRYIEKGLETEKIEKCNSQEFRYIDGAGRGYFLTTQVFSGEMITFVAGNRSVSLKVLERLSLVHPSQVGLKLYLYETAEPKYILYDHVVKRNYNIIIDKSIQPSGSPQPVTNVPDNPPKTLQQVIDDILPNSYTLDYNADAITSYDIAIEGMSVLDAIDHLCSIYGLVWTATTNTVYIFNMEPGETSSDIIPGLTNPINDINHTQLPENLSNINISFPAFNYARTTSQEYYILEEGGSGQGESINVLDPYMPAFLNPLGLARNATPINERVQLIRSNLQAIAASIDFAQYDYYNINSLGTQPLSLSEVLWLDHNGRKTIYQSLKYPYCPAKLTVANNRLANNWWGVLTDGYFGQVPWFTVTPSVPIDGKSPPGPQKVYNKLRWNYGEPGWIVRVEWSPFEAQWNAIMQEYDCPPEEDPQYEVTEPEIPWEEAL